MKPSVGRIVHFLSEAGGRCRAAIVTAVWSDEVVNLYVFPDGSYSELPEMPTSVSLGTDPMPAYTWHWPERVDG